MNERHSLHGVPGQLNVYALDVDTEVTNYGKHARCRVFGALNRQYVYVTADLDKPGSEALPAPTEDDARRVANHEGQRLHPRGSRLELVPDKSGLWEDSNGRHLDYTFRVIRAGK